MSSTPLDESIPTNAHTFSSLKQIFGKLTTHRIMGEMAADIGYLIRRPIRVPQKRIAALMMNWFSDNWQQITPYFDNYQVLPVNSEVPPQFNVRFKTVQAILVVRSCFQERAHDKRLSVSTAKLQYPSYKIAHMVEKAEPKLAPPPAPQRMRFPQLAFLSDFDNLPSPIPL